MKCLLLTFPSHSRKLLPSKNEDFHKIAKVFSVNFLHRMKFAKLKFAKFRDFGDPRKFLPAKVYAFKVEARSMPWDWGCTFKLGNMYWESTFGQGVLMGCYTVNKHQVLRFKVIFIIAIRMFSSKKIWIT